MMSRATLSAPRSSPSYSSSNLPVIAGQRGVDVGDARHDRLVSPARSARRSAFDTTFSSSEIGSRWLTPERLSIFESWRAWNATSSTTSRTNSGICDASASLSASQPGLLRGDRHRVLAVAG